MSGVWHEVIAEARATLDALPAWDEPFDTLVGMVTGTMGSGGKILTCGNGGSAADALHLAEELMGRYRRERLPIPAVCLNADSTLLTCIGNDYGFDEVFARQVTGLGAAGDVLVAFSTSGNSVNIVRALETARARGVKSAALLGCDGGKARGKADVELIVPVANTARIQEVHTIILHALLEEVERCGL